LTRSDSLFVIQTVTMVTLVMCLWAACDELVYSSDVESEAHSKHAQRDDGVWRSADARGSLL